VPGFVSYKKGCTWLAAASDKVYQLLSHGRWFSPGIPVSSTTKTGRHDIAEILLKVALKHHKSKSTKTTFSSLRHRWYSWFWLSCLGSLVLLLPNPFQYFEIHEIFHIVPGIGPRNISPVELRCRAWYGSLVLIPGLIWKMSWNNLLRYQIMDPQSLARLNFEILERVWEQ
jgi:hypothetical protein